MEHFQSVLRFDTSDPPGNERPAAEYLKHYGTRDDEATRKVRALDRDLRAEQDRPSGLGEGADHGHERGLVGVVDVGLARPGLPGRGVGRVQLVVPGAAGVVDEVGEGVIRGDNVMAGYYTVAK